MFLRIHKYPLNKTVYIFIYCNYYVIVFYDYMVLTSWTTLIPDIDLSDPSGFIYKSHSFVGRTICIYGNWEEFTESQHSI